MKPTKIEVVVTIADLPKITQAMQRLVGRERAAMGVLADFADDEPCVLDHDENCQTHNWFGAPTPRSCPNARALRLLAAPVTLQVDNAVHDSDARL